MMKIKQVRLKYKGKDVLGYIIVFVMITCLIIGQLGMRGVITIKYWEIFAYAFLTLMTLGVLNYLRSKKAPIGVDLNSLTCTDDIRMPHFSFKGMLNRGNQFAFAKFYLNGDEIYLYFRGFVFKLYEGPFLLSRKDDAHFGSFYIEEFTRISHDEIKVKIASKEGLTHYGFVLRDFSPSDLQLLEKSLSQLTYSNSI